MNNIEGYRGPESPAEKEDVLEARYRFLQSFNEAATEHIEKEYADKQYHNLEHTETVAAHARDILQIVRSYHPEVVTPAKETAAIAVAYAHDVVQKATKDPKTGRLQRQGGWAEGKNEYESYRTLAANIDHFIELEQQRCEADGGCREDYISDLEEFFAAVNQEAAAAIKATVPDFDIAASLDPEKLRELGLPEHSISSLRSPELLGEDLAATKVSQPNHSEDASIVTLAVALADLSQVGRMSFADALRTGNGEFRELNYKVDEYGERLLKGEELTPEEAELLYTEYLSWAQGQAGFMTWQFVRFNELLDNNTSLDDLEYGNEIREAIREKYAEFPANIDKQITYAHELATKYGPDTPHDSDALRGFYRKEILQEAN